MLKSKRALLGLGVSLLFLALFLWRVDWGQMGQALRDANYLYVIPSLALYFIAVAFRSIRWRVLLAHLKPRINLGGVYGIVVVGYAANNLLPVRLGEFVRAYYLSRLTGVSGSAGLATIIVERIVDGATLLLFFAAAALFIPLGGTVGRLAGTAGIPPWLLVSVASVPFIVALAMLVLIAAFPGKALPLAASLARVLPARLRSPVIGLADRFWLGLAALRDPRRLALVFLLSVPVWVFEGGMYMLIAYGFGIPQAVGSWQAVAGMALLLTAVSNLATSIPAAQGSIGTFESFAAATVTVFGIASGVAGAFVVVMHVALLAPVTVLGLVIMWASNLSLGQIMRGDGTGPSAPAPARVAVREDTPQA